MGGVTCGVDLGGTKIQTVVVDADGSIGEARVPTPRSTADDVITSIVDAAKASLDNASAEMRDLQAVGIGSPGTIDRKRGVVSLASNVPGFTDPIELGPRVSSGLGGVPVKVDNDVRVAILGEHA